VRGQAGNLAENAYRTWKKPSRECCGVRAAEFERLAEGHPDGGHEFLRERGRPERNNIDWARADSEAELQIQRHQSHAHLMRAIEDALARINRGSFGVCEVCKQRISKARLEAVPWTRVCRDCKEE
jgi:RNA polymerase-binding protein DksA